VDLLVLEVLLAILDHKDSLDPLVFLEFGVNAEL